MDTKTRQGQFEILDSFAIKRRNEFYMIGQIKEGTIQEGWFVNIPFNRMMSMTIRISSIEDLQMSNDENDYKLLIIRGDHDMIDLLFGLHVGKEYVDITIEGED